VSESVCPGRRFLLILFLCIAILLPAESGAAWPWGKKDEPKTTDSRTPGSGQDSAVVMTQEELQSQVMSFADRFLVLISDGFFAFEDGNPESMILVEVRRDTLHSIYSCLNIASQPNPEVGLLDMVVLATLGRMIYEEDHLPKYGASVEPIVRAYEMAEEDIWGIVSRILSVEQQADLRSIIREWRRNHPEVLFFAYIRFSDFAADRRKGALGKALKSKGMFSSVKDASLEVEKTRLLAERGLFLGTRLPLLTGQFGNLWLSTWVHNPDVAKILEDFHNFSEVSDRLATMSETLPEQIAAERTAAVEQITSSVTQVSNDAIKQFMEGLTQERKETFQDLIAQEKELRGLLTVLRDSLSEGNKLVASVNALTGGSDTEPSDAESEPFDIKDYQATLQSASEAAENLGGLVGALDELLRSPGWSERLPDLIGLIDRVESETEETLNHAFMLGALFALLVVVIVLLAIIAVRYWTDRVIEQKRRANSSLSL